MGRPKTPQKPQPVNFGEDGLAALGDRDGDIASILWEAEDRDRSKVEADPTLREGLNSPERKRASR